MARTLAICVAFLLLPIFSACADDDMTVVVSVRKLKRVGTSYHHLFLYREDGTQIRQLTNQEGAHDIDPVFSPDGTEVVFLRQMKDEKQFYSIDRNGNNLHKLHSPPKWYATIQTPPSFEYLFSNYFENNPITYGVKDPLKDHSQIFPAPDGSVDVVVGYKREKTTYEEYVEFQTPVLRYKNGREESIINFPGYPDPDEHTSLLVCGKSPFLFEDSLHLFFITRHLGSTDGNSHFYVDLDHKKVVEITFNGGSIYKIPDVTGFFCVCSERYQPFGDQTVDCAYLDWWNEDLKKLRLSSPLSIFGGASIYLESGKRYGISTKGTDVPS